MKVSPKYAFDHFEEIASAVDRGEDIEITRVGKPGLHLVAQDQLSYIPQPGRRILGAGRGQMRVPSEEEWQAMDEELASAMNGPIFPLD